MCLKKLAKLSEYKSQLAEKYIAPFADLSMRLWLAKIFWQSGQTKIGSWETTLLLFEYEYAVPLIPTELAAFLATAAEIVTPIMLLVGFGVRHAALALFVMTVVIELFVFPGTKDHYVWLMLSAALIARGGGTLSLDRILAKKFA